MKPAQTQSTAAVLRWLVTYAGFPRGRLDPRALTLLCAATIAAEQEAGGSAEPRHLVAGRDPAQTSAARSRAIRRSQVHFKCDNSAKV